MKKELAVVLPVYNSGNYIDRCMKSLISQTIFDRMQLVFVNDGSNDNSSEVISRYKNKYSNIELISKPNGGVSSARNEGLTRVNTKYVCFCDPDDYVEEQYYESLLSAIKESNCDMVVVNYTNIFPDKNKQNKQKQSGINVQLSQKEAIKTFLKGGLIGNSLVDKVFVTKIANKILFPQKKIGEDMYYIYNYLQCSKKIFINTNMSGYYYCQNTNSAMHATFSDSNFDALDLSISMTIDCKDDELVPYLQAHENHERCKLIEKMIRNNGKKCYEKDYKEQLQLLRKTNLLKAKKYLTKRQFYGIILMIMSPKLYRVFLKVLKIA